LDPSVHEARSRWPTPSAWLAFGIATVIRALPFAVTRVVSPGDGKAFLPIGYLADDFLQYVAFVRERPVAGSAFLANPFTTDPQGGRFVLLFHQLLGVVYRATGIDGFWLLELSRPLLMAALLLALWRLLRLVLARDRERTWACWLVALSGGFGALGFLAEPLLPRVMAEAVHHDLWTAQGWNTFDAFYNPLWIGALTLLLILFSVTLKPEGPRGIGDHLLAPAIFVVLWLTHPYSAMAAIAVLAAVPIVEWALADAVAWRQQRARLTSIAPGVALVFAIVWWQRGDPVFRASSGNVLGQESLGAFWYPITLGGVGMFAVRGFVEWARIRHPWRHALAAWVTAIALLHPSTIVNGYHFVMYLYPALCIVAAPALASAFDRARQSAWPRLAAGGLAALLFSAPVAVTAADLRALSKNVFPSSALRLVGHLAVQPPGHVLASPDLGNLVPAYGPHRVYVGHWFMTPDYTARSELYWKLVGGEADAATALPGLLDRERIAYVVVPTSAAGNLSLILAPRVAAVAVFEDWTLLTLRPSLQ